MPKLVPILFCRIPAFDSTSQVDRSYKMSSNEEVREADQVAEDANDMAKKIDIRMGNMEERMDNMEKRLGVIAHMISQKSNENGRRRQKDLAALSQTVRSRLPLSDQEKAGQVVETAGLRSWMTPTRPGAFLLHGHVEAFGGGSAIHALCNALPNLVQRKNSHLTVTHVCGRDEDPEGLGQYYGGAAMMRSFIEGLRRHRPSDTNGIQDSLNLAAAHRGQLAEICQTFGRLVSQLDEGTTLICIIDEIAKYERDAKALEAMGYISQLMYDLRQRITIKIFATSTTAVTKMRRFFPDDSILDLVTVSGGGNGGIDRVYEELKAGFAD